MTLSLCSFMEVPKVGASVYFGHISSCLIKLVGKKTIKGASIYIAEMKHLIMKTGEKIESNKMRELFANLICDILLQC